MKGPFEMNGYDFDSYSMFTSWENVGKYLKSTEYWNDNGTGTDDFGFSALPGGFHYIGDGGF